MFYICIYIIKDIGICMLKSPVDGCQGDGRGIGEGGRDLIPRGDKNTR